MIVRGGDDRITGLRHVGRSLGTQQLDFRNLHAVAAGAGDFREQQPVFQVRRAVVEQDGLLLETGREGRNGTARDRGEAHAVIRTFQSISQRIALRSVVGRGQGQALHDAQPDGGRDGEASVEPVEVQILRRLVVDRIGHAFRTRVVVRRGHDGVAGLGDIRELSLDVPAERCRQPGDETEQYSFMTRHNISVFPFDGFWVRFRGKTQPASPWLHLHTSMETRLETLRRVGSLLS